MGQSIHCVLQLIIIHHIFYDSDMHCRRIDTPLSISSNVIFSGGRIRNFFLAVNISRPFSTQRLATACTFNSSSIDTGVKLADLLKRTEITYEILQPIDIEREDLPNEVKEEVEIQIKYEGYIKLQEEQVEKFKKLENKVIPEKIRYDEIKGLRLEARQKLDKVKPISVGQASRISGVSPADISVLLVYLEQMKGKI